MYKLIAIAFITLGLTGCFNKTQSSRAIAEDTSHHQELKHEIRTNEYWGILHSETIQGADSIVQTVAADGTTVTKIFRPNAHAKVSSESRNTDSVHRAELIESRSYSRDSVAEDRGISIIKTPASENDVKKAEAESSKWSKILLITLCVIITSYCIYSKIKALK